MSPSASWKGGSSSSPGRGTSVSATGLAELTGEERGRALAERWAPRFPETYKAATDVDVAAADVLRFAELEQGEEPFVVGLTNEVHDAKTLTRVRLYKIGGKIQLSDFVPTLESLGLRVVEEVPTDLIHDVADERFLQDFGVLAADGGPIDVDATGPGSPTASPPSGAASARWTR